MKVKNRHRIFHCSLPLYTFGWISRVASSQGLDAPILYFEYLDSVRQCYPKKAIFVSEFASRRVGDQIKLWLDVSKKEQAERLAERKDDPLKVLKSSPLDEYAQSRWDAYTAARDEMLTRTDHAAAPWTCVTTGTDLVCSARAMPPRRRDPERVSPTRGRIMATSLS